MKALDRNGPAFSFLCEKSQSLSAEKIKAGVFTEPQIRQLFRDPQFDLALSVDEKAVWNTFRNVATGFQVNAVAYRGGGVNPPPRNSEGSPKSCQTQPDCENLKIAEFRTPKPQNFRKKGNKILKLPKFTIDLH